MDNKIVHAAPVPPFVTFVASAVPMVFDNSMSYYEALCALWKWLQDDVINVINNNATVTEEYIQMTKDMKEYMDNYFDNLDVQEEINNKLDAMVEDGTLQEIITQYIQANTAWYFDTVADMKDAENLINGSYTRTLGYHAINDGGSATYKIRTVTNEDIVDEALIIALNNSETLIAELIVPSVITPEIFGAYGDNDTDDTTIIQKAINYCATHQKPLYLDKMYKVGGLLLNHNNLTMYGAGETTGLSAKDNSSIFTTTNASCTDFTFRDFVIEGNSLGGKAFYSTTDHRLSSYLLDNLTITRFNIALDIESWVTNITNCWFIGNGTAIKLHDCNELRIEGCSIFGFADNTNGIGIITDHYDVGINICGNTFQHLGGALLVYSGSCYTVIGNYFEYNEHATYPVMLFDGSASHDLKSVIISGNYVVPTGSSAVSQTAIDCKYVSGLQVGENVINNNYSTKLSMDADCSGTHMFPLTDAKVINSSNYVAGLRAAYLEGVATNPSNTKYSVAWDRYRSKPIWWDGSKWVYADGSARS